MKKIPDRGKLLTICYHNIFDYPLTKSELERWGVNEDSSFRIQALRASRQDLRVKSKNGYFFLEGQEKTVVKRRANEKTSRKKLETAKRVGKLLCRISTVMFVGITGSLAMMNSNDNSDIDLLIVTSHKSLWTTRVIVYVLLLANGFKLRRPGSANEKDRLCLNMWLDERDLVFTKRNIFTAHELAQIVPLVNKNKTYERLLWENKWILNYWPKAVKIGRMQQVVGRMARRRVYATCYILLATLFEPIAFKLQYLYMKPKITREVVRRNRAFFHPNDWSKRVVDILDK